MHVNENQNKCDEITQTKRAMNVKCEVGMKQRAKEVEKEGNLKKTQLRKME